MTTWALSPVYGTVALGPVQSEVLALALRMTDHGRRPELTLGRMAAILSRSVSSVHDALGRLRALGLLGVSARMGRHGGHRLWRVRSPRGELDAGKHRRAIARIARRFGTSYPRSLGAEVAGGSTPPEPPVDGEGGAAPVPLAPPDPFGVTPLEWTPPPADETFAEKLARYGLGPWIRERTHDGDPGR